MTPPWERGREGTRECYRGLWVVEGRDVTAHGLNRRTHPFRTLGSSNDVGGGGDTVGYTGIGKGIARNVFHFHTAQVRDLCLRMGICSSNSKKNVSDPGAAGGTGGMYWCAQMGHASCKHMRAGLCVLFEPDG